MTPLPISTPDSGRDYHAEFLKRYQWESLNLPGTFAACQVACDMLGNAYAFRRIMRADGFVIAGWFNKTRIF